MIRLDSKPIAILLILAGALLLAGPMFGFTTIAADRGVFLGTADDSNAMLGITDNSGAAEADIRNTNDESVLYYLDDNAGVLNNVDDVSADVVAFDGNPTDLQATVEEDDGTHDYVLIVECGSSDLKQNGHPTVEIEAGDDVLVRLERTTTNPIDVKCAGGGNQDPPGLTVQSVEPADGDTIEFNIANTGEDFRITDLTIEATSISSTTIDSVTIDPSSGGAQTAASEGDGSTVSFGRGNQGVDVGTGETAVVTIEGFADNLNGGWVEVTFIDTHGSGQQDQTLTVNVPCDASQIQCSDTESDVVVPSDGIASNPIETSGDVIVEDEGIVHQGIDAGGDVTLGDNVVVYMPIASGGDITIGAYSKIHQPVTGNGDITIGDGVTLNAQVDITGTATIGCNVPEYRINADSVARDC